MASMCLSTKNTCSDNGNVPAPADARKRITVLSNQQLHLFASSQVTIFKKNKDLRAALCWMHGHQLVGPKELSC